MDNNKKYGLILPKKNQLSAPKAGNVFGNNDDSEEEEGTDWVKKALKAENEKNKVKKQTQINMQKALNEDPTIFQYDEVYDEIERTKEEEKSVKKVERKAKYINNLLKSANLRKKEQELRKDRMIQKEIEAEDAMFPDKERYVTSSYKAKLEEMKQFEKEQENQDRLEAIGDVTKQKDMSGFYRHLYRQTVEKNEADLGIASTIKNLNVPNEDQELQSDVDKDDPIPSDSESDENSNKSDNENKKNKPKESIKNLRKERQYRKRVQQEFSSESELEQDLEKEKKELVKKGNSPKKSSNIETEIPSKKQKLSEPEDKKLEDNKISLDDSITSNKENVEKAAPANNSVPEITEEKPKPVEKIKINIWAKRTVGPVFEAALQRYLMRKEERLSGL